MDADLSAAFDKIDHQRLLTALGSFPARDMIAGWLKAGVVEDGMLAPTREGTPQGGVISPLILNVALHGLEEAAGVRYQVTGKDAGDTRPGSPVVVRYADDLVACCHSREQAEQVKAQLAEWLAPRGLAFNEDKTKIVHLTEGFDFLGVQRAPLPEREAADHAEQRGRRAAPRQARGRDARAARLERGGGHRRAQPRDPGLGGLLPGSGLQQDLQRAGRLRVEAHLAVGQAHPQRKAEAVGRPPLLRQVRQVQERPLGVREPGWR